MELFGFLPHKWATGSGQTRVYHEHVVAKTGWCVPEGLVLILHTFKIF